MIARKTYLDELPQVLHGEAWYTCCPASGVALVLYQGEREALAQASYSGR
jgi:hypothetical protein